MSEANTFEQVLAGDGSSHRPASRWPREKVNQAECSAPQNAASEEARNNLRAQLTTKIDICHQQAGQVIGIDELLRRSNLQLSQKQLSDLDDSPA